MTDHDQIPILTLPHHLRHKLPHKPSRILRPGRNRHTRRRPPRPRPLVIPPLLHQAQIDRQLVLGHLPLQHDRIRARVARHVAGLLDLGHGEDGELLGRDGRVEGEDGGVEGSAERGGEHFGDPVVVREGAGEVDALGFAERGEEWVGHGVVGGAEVVVALEGKGEGVRLVLSSLDRASTSKGVLLFHSLERGGCSAGLVPCWEVSL